MAKTKAKIIRKRLERLERRCEFIEQRIAALPPNVEPHYDIAELLALQWAMAVVRAAIELQLLDEIEEHLDEERKESYGH